ncbi:bromodomain-containing protein 4-like [Oncorhynchus masou masou]|uniref:bromodomain-containing protein 4-like n=1 Tax=Oncorhynchus masou masou TaxID=90313 RepID=UPI0031844F36
MLSPAAVPPQQPSGPQTPQPPPSSLSTPSTPPPPQPSLHIPQPSFPRPCVPSPPTPHGILGVSAQPLKPYLRTTRRPCPQTLKPLPSRSASCTCTCSRLGPRPTYTPTHSLLCRSSLGPRHTYTPTHSLLGVQSRPPAHIHPHTQSPVQVQSRPPAHIHPHTQSPVQVQSPAHVPAPGPHTVSWGVQSQLMSRAPAHTQSPGGSSLGPRPTHSLLGGSSPGPWPTHSLLGGSSLGPRPTHSLLGVQSRPPAHTQSPGGVQSRAPAHTQSPGGVQSRPPAHTQSPGRVQSRPLAHTQSPGGVHSQLMQAMQTQSQAAAAPTQQQQRLATHSHSHPHSHPHSHAHTHPHSHPHAHMQQAGQGMSFPQQQSTMHPAQKGIKQILHPQPSPRIKTEPFNTGPLRESPSPLMIHSPQMPQFPPMRQSPSQPKKPNQRVKEEKPLPPAVLPAAPFSPTQRHHKPQDNKHTHRSDVKLLDSSRPGLRLPDSPAPPPSHQDSKLKQEAKTPITAKKTQEVKLKNMGSWASLAQRSQSTPTSAVRSSSDSFANSSIVPPERRREKQLKAQARAGQEEQEKLRSNFRLQAPTPPGAVSPQAPPTNRPHPHPRPQHRWTMRELRDACSAPPVSLSTHDCVAKLGVNSIIRFADDTTVVGLITNDDEEVRALGVCGQEKYLSLNINKTKELIVDFRRQQREPLSTSTGPQWRR